MSRFILLLSLAFMACREASSDEQPKPAGRADALVPPCEDCLVDAPNDRREAVPLLVVLHGDHEQADDAMKRWRGAALDRGWAVLALTCPKDEGCKQSRWYRWNGDVDWVTQQVRKVQGQLAIDPTRIYLAGWSGGATYIGMNAHRWPSLFAAAVYHGGGQPPLTTRACPNNDLPAYFLVGDKNWAHPAAKRLRDYYERCNQTLVWDLLDGADHPAEDRALDHKKADRILSWLGEHASQPLVGAR